MISALFIIIIIWMDSEGIRVYKSTLIDVEGNSQYSVICLEKTYNTWMVYMPGARGRMLFILPLKARSLRFISYQIF